MILSPVITYSIFFFFLGFAIAGIIGIMNYLKLRKKYKSTEGLLESERLIKETLRKENSLAFKLKESVELELGKKYEEATNVIKIMDQDILLLQKDNEETESLVKTTQPELYNLKLKLIEANNTVARLKAQLNEQK
jgi:hypothetical protein